MDLIIDHHRRRYATIEVVDPGTGQVRHAVVNAATGKVIATYGDPAHAACLRTQLDATGAEPGRVPLRVVPAARPWSTHVPGGAPGRPGVYART